MVTNITENEGGHILGLEVAISSTIVLALASAFGTFGNVLLLVVIVTTKDMRSPETIFVSNLAMSDLYVTAIADPMGILAKLYGVEFFDRLPGLCQTVASMCTISCVASLMTIALMSVNRYFYICKHDIYRVIFTYRNVLLMCLSLYLIGTFLVLLNVAGIGDHNFDHKSFECIWDRMATFPYTVVFSVTLVWIPTIVTGTCYLRIYTFVSAHRRKIRQQINADTNKDNHGIQAPRMRKLHLAKTLFTIYAVFTTCWIPYALLIVVDSKDEFPHEVHVYITMFAHLHPSLNWVIYYLTNKKFSDAYKQLLYRCCAGRFGVRGPAAEATRGTRLGRDTTRPVTESSASSPRIPQRNEQMKMEDVTETDLEYQSRSRSQQNGHTNTTSEI